jgi:hypothetical protein
MLEAPVLVTVELPKTAKDWASPNIGRVGIAQADSPTSATDTTTADRTAPQDFIVLLLSGYFLAAYEALSNSH